MNNKNRIIPWIPAVIWMVIIFCLSSQPAIESNGLSRGVTGLLLEIIGRFLPIDVETVAASDLIGRFNHYVRKSAHFISYLILGILVIYALIKVSA